MTWELGRSVQPAACAALQWTAFRNQHKSINDKLGNWQIGQSPIGIGRWWVSVSNVQIRTPSLQAATGWLCIHVRWRRRHATRRSWTTGDEETRIGCGYDNWQSNLWTFKSCFAIAGSLLSMLIARFLPRTRWGISWTAESDSSRWGWRGSWVPRSRVGRPPSRRSCCRRPPCSSRRRPPTPLGAWKTPAVAAAAPRTSPPPP